MATLRMISPRATAGRMAFLCWALAASSTMSAPSTPELQNGPGILVPAEYGGSESTLTDAAVHGLAPQHGHQARRLALERDDRVRRRLALDERAGRRSQHLLRFGQGQVHGQAPLCSCRHCRTSPPWLQAAPAAIAMATKIVSAISASPAPAMAAFCV